MVDQAARAGIMGAAGYGGAEMLRLLAGHPGIEVVVAGARSHAGAAVADLYPSLEPVYPGLVLEDVSSEGDGLNRLTGLDLVFLALPHGESQRLAPQLVEQVGHVVDLGADFRTPADWYARWYGKAHKAPALIDQFAFGLPELYRDEIAKHSHVAAPGCYPTTTALALAPAFAAGFVVPDVVVDAVSGISGRGRGLSEPSLYAEANENVAAYGLLEHRHTGEMEFALEHVAGQPVQVLFTPRLVPMTRGILATCYAKPAVDGLSTAKVLDTYRDFYADEPW
jgi:N-acetyl-gamma-glutamyl-phosphate reductase